MLNLRIFLSFSIQEGYQLYSVVHVGYTPNFLEWYCRTLAHKPRNGVNFY